MYIKILPLYNVQQYLYYRIQQDIDLRTFCEEMRITSAGYLTYDINIPISNYSPLENCSVNDINISVNSYYSPETRRIYFDKTTSKEFYCRSCNMLVLGNKDAKIMVATPPTINVPMLYQNMDIPFEIIRNRVIVLQCDQYKQCSLFTSLIVDRLELRYQPLSTYVNEIFFHLR